MGVRNHLLASAIADTAVLSGGVPFANICKSWREKASHWERVLFADSACTPVRTFLLLILIVLLLLIIIIMKGFDVLFFAFVGQLHSNASIAVAP